MIQNLERPRTLFKTLQELRVLSLRITKSTQTCILPKNKETKYRIIFCPFFSANN